MIDNIRNFIIGYKNKKINYELLIISICSVFILLFYAFIAKELKLSGTFSDSVHYLFMADYLSGDINVVSVSMYRHSVFPPLYPAFLSLFSAGSHNIHLAHIMTIICLFAFLFLYLNWLKNNHIAPFFAYFIVLLFAISDITIHHSLFIASEFLFLFLVIAVFIAYDKSQNSLLWLYITSVLIGLAILTRTAGIALLASFIIVLLMRSWNKNSLLAILTAVSFPALWKLYSSKLRSGKGYSKDLLEHYVNNSFSENIDVLFNNITNIFFTWPDLFVNNTLFWHQSIAYFILFIAFFVLVIRIIAFKIDAYFLSGYLAIIVIWPYPMEIKRFLLIIIPIVLFYNFYFFQWLKDNHYFEKSDKLTYYLPLGLLLLMFVMILPSFFDKTQRFLMPIDSELEAYKRTSIWLSEKDQDSAYQLAKIHKTFISALTSIQDYISPDDCFYTNYQDIALLYSERMSVRIPVNLNTKAEPIKYLKHCNYIMFSSYTDRQNKKEKFYPYPLIKEFIKPVFESSMTENNKKNTIVALGKIKR